MLLRQCHLATFRTFYTKPIHKGYGPRPHPLMRRNGLVNQVEFLGLAHTFATVPPSTVPNILRQTRSKKVRILGRFLKFAVKLHVQNILWQTRSKKVRILGRFLKFAVKLHVQNILRQTCSKKGTDTFKICSLIDPQSCRKINLPQKFR